MCLICWTQELESDRNRNSHFTLQYNCSRDIDIFLNEQTGLRKLSLRFTPPILLLLQPIQTLCILHRLEFGFSKG
jgi:hypothetical protein